MSGTQAGIHYQLYNGLLTVGSAVTGTGASLSFGLQTTGGVYSVVATNTVTGCTANMSGTTIVSVNALPTAQTVTGGGTYCSGNPGVPVGLAATQTGVTYQLYRGTSVVTGTVIGTGSVATFGLQTTPGVYSVYATNNTTGCISNMTGIATVIMNTTVNPSVTLIAMPGDTVCAGTNVAYQLLTSGGGTTPTYQWTVNTVNVSNLNNYNYVPDSGDVVTVTMMSSDACASPATATAALTMTVNTLVTPMVSVTANPGDTVCRGTTVMYTATGVYGGNAGYSWMVNGATVGAGTTYSYTPQNGDVVVNVMTSDYACSITGTAYSTPQRMVIDTALVPSVVLTANPGRQISPNQADTISAVVINGGTAPTYQWLVNGSIISGATHPTYVSTFNDGDSVSCVVTSNSPCGGVSAFNSLIIHIIAEGVTTLHTTGDIRLQPNPNKGAFTVKGTLGSTADEDVTIELTDVLGQVVYKSQVTARGGNLDEHIQLSSTVANGMYVLSVHSATESKVFHVVIEQ
jgi:hypothetical protein